MTHHTLHLGDCLEVLRTMPGCSVDAVVTDPPYGLSFMGKAWDYDVPGVDVWQEVLRVLKPGGHLLAFAGTKTQHRIAVAIEDAGFEIRDMIAWVYGSGFPKSLDVSKAIDKCNAQPDRLHKFTAWMRTTGLTARQLDRITDTNMGGHYLTAASQPAIPTAALWELIRPHCGDVPAWVDELVQRIEAEREVVGQKTAGIANPEDRDRHTIGGSASVVVDITAPATPEAQQWDGWGTALKPALEPITMARKSFKGTVAANVLEHGTGALNIDATRIKSNDDGWPSNLVHDDSAEARELLRHAARFFYTSKATAAERQGATHPTVKPLDLMAYLCRLVTPPKGTVLDPFMGSGTTIKAALSEGFNAIGIERDPAYFAMAEHRLNGAQLGLGL